MTEGIEAHKTFIAMKLHFTSDYDFHKYNGKIREGKFDHKNEFTYRRLERKYKGELIDFMVSNFVQRPVFWIGDLNNIQSDQIYVDWKKKMQSFTYNFKNDVNYLLETYEDIRRVWDVVNGDFPEALVAYLHGKISLETLMAADNLIHFFPIWEENISDIVRFPEFAKLWKKYKPFLRFQNDKNKEILLDVYKKNLDKLST